ncbi:unannotated protein [freshwater metagenome]|uniref:Unannotated protein n=1 Tax=freshwater metagenome TaxID=449393 RepID=A0A6J5ZB79_9ZZZZ
MSSAATGKALVLLAIVNKVPPIALCSTIESPEISETTSDVRDLRISISAFGIVPNLKVIVIKDSEFSENLLFKICSAFSDSLLGTVKDVVNREFKSLEVTTPETMIAIQIITTITRDLVENSVIRASISRLYSLFFTH